DGHPALRAQRTFDFDLRETGALNLTMAAMLDPLETRLTRVTPAGQSQIAVSRLDTICTDHALEAERLVCMAFDGARTHVLTFAPAWDAAQPIGWFAGHCLPARPTREGWVSGWTTTNAGMMNLPTPVAIDLTSRRLVVFPRELRVEEVTAAGPVAAAVSHDMASTRIRLYSLDR